MTPDEAQQIAAVTMIVIGVSVVVSLGVYVWYAVMLAKVFAQFGRPAWSAWVPVYNDMQVFRIGGQQPWLALLLYVPFAQLVGLVFKVFALHRISLQSWRGTGTTVLGVLLPPVWATVLAIGPSPDPERVRMPRGTAGRAIPPVQPSAPQSAAPLEPVAWPAPTGASTSALIAPMPSFAPAVPAGSGAPAVPTAVAAAAQTAAPLATAAPIVAPSSFGPPAPAAPAPAPQSMPARIDALPPMPMAPRVAPIAAPPVPQPERLPYAQPLTEDTAVELPHARVASSHLFGAPAVASPLDAYGADIGDTIVTGDDDVFDRTVVVDRRPRATWRLVLVDGTALVLEATTVVLGRNPRAADAGEQPLVVPDPSRTLSKTHARLRFDGEQWTITDLDSTNGVLIADATGTDQLLDAGVPTPVAGRFVLGTLEVRIEQEQQQAGAFG